MTLADFGPSDFVLFTIFLFVCRLRGVELAAAGAYVLCSIIFTVGVLAVPVSDIAYYTSAALADFIALIILCCIRPVGDLVYGLAHICVASILLNIVGLLLWWLYLPPWPYDLAFAMLYVCALVVVGRGGADGMGGRPARWGLARPAFPIRARRTGVN
ncbi:hypothetical protein [Vibrio phage VP16T]|nr:hypothetical protein [Vibrio phage VP16T]